VSPIRHLQRLYAVVLGVAMGLSVERVLGSGRNRVPIRWEEFPLFLAFAVVAFGFYHLSVRYLDLAYDASEQRKEARRRVVRDLVLGGIQLLLVVALGVFIDRPETFGYTLLLLFVVNVGGLLLLRGMGARPMPVERHALPADLVGIACLTVVLLLTTFIIDSAETDEIVLRVAATTVAIGRVLWQYARALDELYFGVPEGQDH
jgi:hypothetical protein